MLHRVVSVSFVSHNVSHCTFHFFKVTSNFLETFALQNETNQTSKTLAETSIMRSSGLSVNLRNREVIMDKIEQWVKQKASQNFF